MEIFLIVEFTKRKSNYLILAIVLNKIRSKFTVESPSAVIIKCYFKKFKSSILCEKLSLYQHQIKLSFQGLNYLTDSVLLNGIKKQKSFPH